MSWKLDSVPVFKLKRRGGQKASLTELALHLSFK